MVKLYVYRNWEEIIFRYTITYNAPWPTGDHAALGITKKGAIRSAKRYVKRRVGKPKRELVEIIEYDEQSNSSESTS